MSSIDWTIMLGTLGFIALYGIWKTRHTKNIAGYLKGDNEMNWATIGLSVMATQASAITFLATPGIAYEKGMGFVQFYFGLPLAMVIIAVFFIPLYYKLKVYTAYEFLESRFDRKTRMLTATLFLIQRSLAAGITIYAPAIVLSQILDWSLSFTILFIGVMVIAYTVSGGTKAVSQTHKLQMAVIFGGMFLAFGLIVWHLSDHLSFGEAIKLAGKFGKMEVVNLDFDPDNRYTLWSGLLGGLFLQLSYFGTDQSQVQRYLSGRSVRESRVGLLFNGIVKIPMQFFILLTGVLVFVFFQFNQPPIHFNQATLDYTHNSEYSHELEALEKEFEHTFELKLASTQQYLAEKNTSVKARILTRIEQQETYMNALKDNAKELMLKVDGTANTRESNYIFISFIMKYLPVGVVGILLAMIFSGAMSSTSAELNALASTATIDIYKRNIKSLASDKHYLLASRGFTFLWGLLAITFALLASMVENLVEAVNILGSVFYPVILGVFLVAFFFKNIRGNAVFWSALIAEAAVILMYFYTSIAFLWYNLIGVGLVIFIAVLLEIIIRKTPQPNRVH